MTPRRAAIALLLAATLALTACAGARTTGPQQPSAAPETATSQPASPTAPVGSKGVIVFDYAHGEIFAPNDTSELGQSNVVGKMQQSGYEVRINDKPIDEKTLDGVAALYVPGPMRNFKPEEQKILDDYLERGGTVILSIHVPYPVLGLPARWGLPVRTGVMTLVGPNAGADPGVFLTESMVEDPLTEGVKRVLVVSGWPVDTDTTKLASAKLVVLAAGNVVADTNANGQLDDGDQQQPFGVVGVAPVGSGRVVVLGDDAIFANVGINEGDNMKLFENILKLISAPKGA